MDKSVNLSRNWTQLTYFASLSLKADELKTFLRKDEILELPRRQNTIKMFSVVPTTRNRSTTHRSRRTTREKWTVTWLWSCAVAYLSVAVVRSRRILNSLIWVRPPPLKLRRRETPQESEKCSEKKRKNPERSKLSSSKRFKSDNDNQLFRDNIFPLSALLCYFSLGWNAWASNHQIALFVLYVLHFRGK